MLRRKLAIAFLALILLVAVLTPCVAVEEDVDATTDAKPTTLTLKGEQSLDPAIDATRNQEPDKHATDLISATEESAQNLADGETPPIKDEEVSLSNSLTTAAHGSERSKEATSMKTDEPETLEGSHFPRGKELPDTYINEGESEVENPTSREPNVTTSIDVKVEEDEDEEEVRVVEGISERGAAVVEAELPGPKGRKEGIKIAVAPEGNTETLFEEDSETTKAAVEEEEVPNMRVGEDDYTATSINEFDGVAKPKADTAADGPSQWASKVEPVSTMKQSEESFENTDVDDEVAPPNVGDNGSTHDTGTMSDVNTLRDAALEDGRQRLDNGKGQQTDGNDSTNKLGRPDDNNALIQPTATTAAMDAKARSEQTERVPTVKELCYRPDCGTWGVRRADRRYADRSILARLFQAVIEKDENVAAAYLDEIVSTTTASSRNFVVPNVTAPLEGESDDKDDPPARNRSPNAEFVEGLDDIDKFFEGVDIPDEMDVGASGLSIQEVLMGKGTQIILKRLQMALVAIGEALVSVKIAVVEKVEQAQEIWARKGEFVDKFRSTRAVFLDRVKKFHEDDLDGKKEALLRCAKRTFQVLKSTAFATAETVRSLFDDGGDEMLKPQTAVDDEIRRMIKGIE